ncbi:DJ-1/PfpI family protein [Paenisporosarcina cavernae]|uniref:Glutamine amidotransferase n=1 Tax=Paenisporosarcina cavernae TaxID=2320858 RepID=A0A385YSV3_9BACL|nr:DJ-1/PfpI family protein [Paenisporosarcina cavernae]AYC28523.1 glutamine amidotransferase [Paenisporosarcina cavernae]
MKKALLLLSDQYAEFEVIIASMVLKSKGYTIHSFTMEDEKRPIIGTSSLLTYPTHTFNELEDAREYGVFIAPGGHPLSLLSDDRMLQLVRDVHASGGLIAGICAGTSVPSTAGLLEGKTFSTQLSPEDEEYAHVHDWSLQSKDDITVDNRIVTAPGSAYVEFAVEIAKQLNVMSEEESIETLRYFKNQLKEDALTN